MKKRPDVPKKTAARVLAANSHACCVCRNPDKSVQLHHIDGDPTNNDPKNLAVLCLDHHSRATGNEGFGRRFTAQELRESKHIWEALCKGLTEAQAERATGTHQRGAQQPLATGVVPPVPEPFVGRAEQLARLKESLDMKTIVVQGWPGVGKTSLAAAITRDAEVATTFKDGVLWTSLGQEPDLLSALGEWTIALGGQAVPAPTSVKAAVARLAALLQQQRMLLVVDDVWEEKDIAPIAFVAGSESCLLITTRLPGVVGSLVRPLQSIQLRGLAEQDAIDLLHVSAPSAVEEYRDECLDLVRAVEGLPLALQVAGRLLHAEEPMGWSAKDLLAELRDGSRLMEETAPPDRVDLEHQTIPTVAALFQRSTARLDTRTREAFALLGVFPPTPGSFDTAALKAVWHVKDPKPIIRTLVARGLLEPLGDERFHVHALLLMHARSLLSP